MAFFTAIALAQETASEAELDTIAKDFNNLRQELAAAQQAYGNLQNEYSVKAKGYDNKVIQLENELAALTRQIENLKKKEQSWENESRQFSNSIAKFTNLLQDKEKNITELKLRQQQYVVELKNFEARVNLEQKQKVSLENQLKEVKAKNDVLEKTNQEALISLQDKEKILMGLEKNWQELLKKHAGDALRIKDCQDKIIASENEKQNLDGQLVILQSKEKTFQEQNKEAALSLEDKEKYILGLNQREKKMLVKQEEYVSKLEEYKIKLGEIENENTNFKNQIKELQSKVDAASGEGENLDIALKDKMDSSKDVESLEKRLFYQSKNYQEQLRSAQEAKNNLQEKNKRLAQGNKILKQKLDIYPRKLSQIALLKERLLKENAVLHYNLGVFHVQKQEYSDAIYEFEKVLELNPDDSATHYNLGVIYAEYLDNRPKAISHFNHYLMQADKDDKDVEFAKKYLLTWEQWEEAK